MTRTDRDRLEDLLAVVRSRLDATEEALADVRQWLDTIPLPPAAARRGACTMTPNFTPAQHTLFRNLASGFSLMHDGTTGRYTLRKDGTRWAYVPGLDVEQLYERYIEIYKQRGPYSYYRLTPEGAAYAERLAETD